MTIEVTSPQLDLLRAGLSALSKKVNDRIKNNRKFIEHRPTAPKHIAHLELRLQEIEALMGELKEEK